MLLLATSAAVAQDEIVPPPPDANNPIVYPNNPSWNQTEMKIICTSFVFPPMVFCDPAMPPETYTGFQIDLFKATAAELGWELGRDYTFRCMDWLPQQDDLVSENGTCYSVATGLDVQTFHLDRGIKFGNSFFQAGYKIMLAAPSTSEDAWTFLKAFSWQVWVLLLCTALFVPAVAWFVEGMVWGPYRALDHHHQSYRYLTGLGNMVWHYSCMIVSFEPLDFRTWAARILALAYGFLLTVALALYTANTAAQLAVASATSQIKGINDLQGKAVGTIDQYADILNGYGVRASLFRWSSHEDEVKFLQDLTDGVYTAIIVDSVWVDYTAATDPECRFRAAGPSFKLNNYAIAYPSNFPDAAINEWNLAMERVQARLGIIDTLNSQYIDIASNCTFATAAVPKLSIGQVAGLWYILAAAIGIAFLWMLVALLDKKRFAEAEGELRHSFHNYKDIKQKPLDPQVEPGVVIEDGGPSQKEIIGDVSNLRNRLVTFEKQLVGSNVDFHRPFQVVQ